MRTRLVIALLLCPLTLWAQTARPIVFSASYALLTDSNLFRLPAAANTTQLIGRDSAAERIGVGQLGVNLEAQHSLQRFTLDARLVDYRYQNFSYLSFNARNYNAAWYWSVTPQVTGKLAADRAETLNSFTDYQGYTQRNLRVTTNNSASLDYAVAGPWHLLASLGQNRQDNEQALVAGSDYATHASSVGLRHAFASGSSVTYSYKNSNGSYLNRTVPNAGAYDSHYTQTEHDVRLRWLAGAGHSVDANLSAISRSHPNYPVRDFSGIASAASANLALSAKTSLRLAYAHELAAYQTSDANSTQADRFSLTGLWAIGPKLQLSLRTEWAQTDYLGSTGTAPPSQRRDTTRDYGLTVDWQPRQNFNLSAGLQSASRGATQANLDYSSTSTTVSAQYSF